MLVQLWLNIENKFGFAVLFYLVEQFSFVRRFDTGFGDFWGKYV